MSNILLGEERRRAIVDFINAVRNYAINAHADEKFTGQLDNIQQRIESANVLETWFADFGIKEHREAEAIFQKIRAEVKRAFRERDIRTKRHFQASAIPVGLGLFFLYYLLVHRGKLVPADFTHEAVCISLGVFIATVFYIVYTLILYFTGKRVSAHEEWSFSRQVFITLTVASIVFFPSYLAVQLYSVNLYIFSSPYLVTVVQGAMKLDVGSLFTTVSLILGDLAALFATWDFIQKRLRKQKNDTSTE